MRYATKHWLISKYLLLLFSYITTTVKMEEEIRAYYSKQRKEPFL
jgi:hypothetical protein